jgi:hypothetical protein
LKGWPRRHCEERSDEAIQKDFARNTWRFFGQDESVDCFAPLAMTGQALFLTNPIPPYQPQRFGPPRLDQPRLRPRDQPGGLPHFGLASASEVPTAMIAPDAARSAAAFMKKPRRESVMPACFTGGSTGMISPLSFRGGGAEPGIQTMFFTLSIFRKPPQSIAIGCAAPE